MQAFNFKRQLCAMALLVLITVGASVQAATLAVNCGGNYGLTSINGALKALQNSEESHGPATINVSGACRENILIQNIDRLTLNAVNGASITDGSNGSREVINVDNSHGFTLKGFSITSTCPATCQGLDAISCYYGADCLLIQNTISGAGGAGVGVYALSRARIVGGTLQHNGNGLFVAESGEMLAQGVGVRNNRVGAVLTRGASLIFRAAEDHVTPTVIANNQAQGISATDGSTVAVGGPSNIIDNGAEGILLDLGSKLVFGTVYGPVSITGNVGPGVSLGDLSVARFAGTSYVTGNGQPDLACNSPTAVTRRATTGIGGGTTNCAN